MQEEKSTQGPAPGSSRRRRRQDPRKLTKTATPGIFKRGGRYVVTGRDPNGRPVKRFARTLTEARDVKASQRADVSRGEYRERSKVTFAEYARTWVETYTGRTSRGIEAHTLADYRARLERDAVPFFGRMRLSAIEPSDLKAFAASVAARGVKLNTVRLSVAPVRALLATAHEDGLLRSNPAAGLRLLAQVRQAVDVGDEDEDAVKALAPNELTALLAAIPDESRLFFTFLSQTGLRIGEAIELRWRDCDLGQRWLDVRRRYYRGSIGRPKGRKMRRVRITEAMARDLWALRKATKAGDDDLVFTAEQGGRIDGSNLMRRVLKPAGRASGVGDWVGFHSFRHTTATMLFRGGWNAVQVQRFLGHSDPGFTLRRYVHLLPEDLPEPKFTQLGDAVPTGHWERAEPRAKAQDPRS